MHKHIWLIWFILLRSQAQIRVKSAPLAIAMTITQKQSLKKEAAGFVTIQSW